MMQNKTEQIANNKTSKVTQCILMEYRFNDQCTLIIISINPEKQS